MDKMDRDWVDKIQAEAQAAFDAGDHEKAESILREAMKEASRNSPGIPVTELQSIASFVQKAVDTALKEIVEIADELHKTHVPVELLRNLIGVQCTGVTMLWQTMDRLEVPVDFGVPDDLSGLEGA